VKVHTPETRLVFWHRELPPASAELMAEHTLEANSTPVPGALAYRDELWRRCYQEGMAQARERLEQEIKRLGGDYAHVLSESVESKHDPVRAEAWLHIRLTYMLYREK